MREEIEKIPDGVYRAQGIIEQMKGKDDIVIEAKVEIKGSDIIVDLDGSSRQVNWGGNVVFNFTFAYVFMAVKSMFAPDIPNNDGCARPIQAHRSGRDRVNCKFPAAVAARMGVGHFLTEVIYRALSDVLPGKVIAASGGTPAAMNVFYGKRKDGKPWHSVIIGAAAWAQVPIMTAIMSTSSRPMAPIHPLKYSRAIPRLSLRKGDSSPIRAVPAG